MRFLKLLFSKIVVVTLLFIAQMVLLAVVLQYFSNYYYIFQLLSYVVSIIMLLVVINKKQSPEFKLPWIILFIFLPLFTMVIYHLFSQPKMPKRTSKKLNEYLSYLKPYVKLDYSVLDYLDEGFNKYVGIERYLNKNAYSQGYTGCKVSYFKSGEDWFVSLKEELNKAQKFIFLEYFIIGYGKMWDEMKDILVKKVACGVEVRVIYDDIGSSGYVKNRFYKELESLGISCVKFNPFKPILSGIHNYRDHRKITVIDGKVAFTGGANITDDYINLTHRLGYWKDSVIKIEGSAVNNLTGMFLMSFDINKKQISDFDKYFLPQDTIVKDGTYVHPFGDGPRPSYKEQVGENTFINMINSAQKSVYITTPYLIIDYNMSMALKNASLRGVDVKIVTPSVPDKRIIFNMSRGNFPFLIDAGVDLYEYTPGFIHAKNVLIDEEYAFVGTINLDYRSFVHHYECGAVMYGHDAIKDIKTDFEDLFKVSKKITADNFKMGFFARLISALLNIFSPML